MSQFLAMEDVPEVLHVDLEIDEAEPRAGILTLLQSLRPDWSPEQVHMKTFTEGMTNRLIGCFLRPERGVAGGVAGGGADADAVLVRVYGRHTELYVDRREEVRTLRLLETRGLGSKVYCSFSNGICYQFLQGAPLRSSQLTRPEVYRLVAAEMARLHSVQTQSSESEPFLWKKMEHFLKLIQTSQSESREDDSQSESREDDSQSESREDDSQSESREDDSQSESREDDSQSESREDDSQSEQRENHTDQSENRWQHWAGPLPGPHLLRTEMELLKSRLGRVQSPVVLSHNDLLHNNIIYHPERGTVRFIDFEYASLNHQAFDIGNHFNEFAGVDAVDYSRYPSESLQRDWIRTYLRHFHLHRQENLNHQKNLHNQENLNHLHDVSEQEVTRLYVHVCKFSLASNLFWGMWAILQARLSNIHFDFSSYAATRLDFYFQKRDQYLSLELEPLDLEPLDLEPLDLEPLDLEPLDLEPLEHKLFNKEKL